MATIRSRGVRVVLVTGRILAELVATCPDIADHVDLIVAENGALLHDPLNGSRCLSSPVQPELIIRLRARGVEVRQGEVLLALRAADEQAVHEELWSLGVECQLIRNRGELMVLPHGVNKGSGVCLALAQLGLSRHNTVAIGDAENDHSLLDACEVGIAVGDAVKSLRQAADLVLDRPDGAGVADLLSNGGLEGIGRRSSPRTRLVVGEGDDGPITLPSAALDVLVAGDTGAGKSYVAGMLTEQLIRQEYSVLVIDPEGDHLGLGALPGVALIGGHDDLLPPAAVVRLAGPGRSIVVDLSPTSDDDAASFLAGLWPEIEAHRALTGMPHWVVIDEAQRVLAPGRSTVDSASKGHLFVSWRADEIPGAVLAGLDAVVAVGGVGGAGSSGSTAVAATVGSVASEDVHPDGPGRGTAPGIAVTRRWEPGIVAHGWAGARETAHRRHRHKYGLTDVGVDRSFRMWSAPGPSPSDEYAATLGELEVRLALCPAATIAHHATHRDFSRWVNDVTGDRDLADALRRIEEKIVEDVESGSTEKGRVDLLAALQDAPYGA